MKHILHKYNQTLRHISSIENILNFIKFIMLNNKGIHI